MTLIFKMAFQNVVRNKRRSVATVASVSMGLAAMLFLWSYNDSTVLDMKLNTIDFITGHLQILPKDAGKLKTLTLGPAASDKAVEILKQDPEVAAVSERLRTQALVSFGERSQGVYVVGADPGDEARVTRIREKMMSGRYLSGDKNQVMLGQHLAKKLGVNPGDRVVLMAQDAYGMSMGYTFEVTGIFRLGDRLRDERFVYTDLSTLRQLLDTPAGVSEIAVRLKNMDTLDRAASRIADRLKGEPLSVQAWYRVVPEVNQLASWGSAIFFIVMIVMVVVIAMGIMNSMLMSVFERTREFGVMLALGTQPWQLIRLVFAETAVLELIGIAGGMVLGYGLIHFFGTVGISLESVSDALEHNFMSPVIYTSFNSGRAFQASAVLAGVTLMTTIYPIIRVGRLEPVRAIYRS